MSLLGDLPSDTHSIRLNRRWRRKELYGVDGQGKGIFASYFSLYTGGRVWEALSDIRFNPGLASSTAVDDLVTAVTP